MSLVALPRTAVARSADALSSAMVHISGYGRATLDAAADRMTRRAVTNNPAPLLLFAVIAVAAAVVAIAVMGLAAAWLMYCTANWPGSWPAVGVPTNKNGFYYFGCMVPR